RLIEIYKLGQARYLRLLLSTPDLRRLGQSTRTVAALAKLDRDRVDSHAHTIGELEATRKTLEQRRGELGALGAAAEKADVAARRAAQARSELIRDIDRRRDLNAQLAGELQVAQQKLQAALRELVNGAPAAETAALPLRPFRGDLEWPVNGVVKRRFGRGAAPNGIEIAAVEGAQALAVHDGVVAFAGTFAGFGNLVILDHGSQTFTLYGDLLEITVKKGARAEHGQPVGTVGPIPSGSDGLDPDGAYLTVAEVKQVESGVALPPGGVGLELTRQYYLRVIAARDNSPAAKAGLRTGDYIRAINDIPTREMSVWEGIRALRGTPGTKVTMAIIRGNAADPHVIELTRENEPASVVNGRMAGAGIGYVRVAAIGSATAGQVKSQVAELTKSGASKLVV